MNNELDHLIRFTFEQANVRGEIVRLQDSYRSILESYPYPQQVQRLLGELMAACSLLTATLKFSGDIALQLQSEGPVKYAVINGTDTQQLRGVARYDESLETLPDTFNDLLPKGLLVITITPRKGERYQGVVALEQESLAACIENYFIQSEQLATQVRLFADTEQKLAGGTLLQVLPQNSAATHVDDVPEFEHFCHLNDTLQPSELFALPAHDILHRLYHQEQVRVYPPQPIAFNCGCSKERSANALAGIDKQELLSMLEQDGEIRMNCQYCHREYVFDAVDIESLHAHNSSSSRLQ
ncbi:Hsp33 family molecular chaperone HslO [Aestuariibacter salexigens]|uniref:Hsp33 family molecular chaperone HslO n=1 Tax=Aestuariibacter salexigens TaxID=226010 RepID=UPI0004227506|nr:Hsp33 family molecular chaperone HslO [Aestuariibacter salexigens]